MTIFMGSFEAASRHLPLLEKICCEHGGTILMTKAGISYELPAIKEEQEPALRLVNLVSMEPVKIGLQQAA